MKHAVILNREAVKDPVFGGFNLLSTGSFADAQDDTEIFSEIFAWMQKGIYFIKKHPFGCFFQLVKEPRF